MTHAAKKVLIKIKGKRNEARMPQNFFVEVKSFIVNDRAVVEC